ncbi:MAG: hypothetical protein Q4D25_10570 [Bacteroidales bacterium]|nr:hypothetical protein [Bacteroidales bacterium]
MVHKFSSIKTDGDLNKVILKLRLRFIPLTKDVINEIRVAITKPSLTEKFNKILERDFPESMKSLRGRKTRIIHTPSLFKRKRESFEEHMVYVEKIKEYFEEKFVGKPIHSSDITLALHKFNLRNNPECFKIEKDLKLYADSHNNQMYIDTLKSKADQKRRNTPLQEKIFSWDDIAFGDGFINVRDEENHLVCREAIEYSKSAFNSIKTYFKIQFPELEICIINNEISFNDADRFKKLLTSIKSNTSSYCPDLEVTPKYVVFAFFNNLSSAAIKNYIIELKQKYLSYLCSKQLDDYKIQYCVEQRVNMENEALENAFVFTIAETYQLAIIVFENIEDDRSSIVFVIHPKQYDLAMKSICGFFSSRELNKRETLAENYVEFKDSGIIKIRRLYHNDFQQWKKEIDRLSNR